MKAGPRGELQPDGMAVLTNTDATQEAAIWDIVMIRNLETVSQPRRDSEMTRERSSQAASPVRAASCRPGPRRPGATARPC
jgi:hypothetical protein